jgi:raffinose synthase
MTPCPQSTAGSRRGLHLLLLLAGLAASFHGAVAASAMNFSLQNGILKFADRPVLREVPDAFAVVPDGSGTGVFLRMSVPKSGSFIQSPLGAIDGLRRFTSCHRYEPFWMRPEAGTTHAEVRPETQWLLAETETGECVMLVPLIDGAFRFALGGTETGLTLSGETGDPFTAGTGGVALFIATGRDPYQLAAAGARAVAARLGTARLRAEKPLPDFAGLFGWCTWDAFYREVSADKVRAGLESFAAGGVEPRFLILDDGWQSTKVEATGEERLSSLAPNERFSGDLSATVRLAKESFKIRTFLVWHALNGYWGGVDGGALPGYEVKEAVRSYGPGILQQEPRLNVEYWGPLAGLVPAGQIGRFMDDYHRRLRAQGVDGVKVDNQAVIESLAAGQGGRVALTRAYREALESSVAANFGGRLINCMSNGMETYYGSPRSTLIRTSIDFWPKRPETHGAHLYCNAQVGVWFGEFMQPDWDMFQSGHAMGAFHAAGRAVSGGPVYVSDKIDAHNFAVLRKLVLSDGSVLRADQPGRPTRDCLFANVTREPVLLKVFNYNRDCAVIGLFNANYHAAEAARVAIMGAVSPSDAPGLAGDEFAAFAQQANRVWRGGRADREPVKLAEGDWEIVSFAPVDHGVAVLGLADKFNSTGAITARSWNADGTYTVTLRDGGEFIAWTEKPPRAVEADGQAVAFRHDAATGRLSATVPATGPKTVLLRW